MNKLQFSIYSLLLFCLTFGQKIETSPQYKIEDYQRIISDINTNYFNTHFQNKYKNDSLFYKEKLSMDTNLKVLDNFNVILESILADPAQSKKDRSLADLALEYNKVYAKYHQLMTNQQDFYKQKYEAKKANEFIAALNALQIEKFEGLMSNRQKELEKINSFNSESCKLKFTLDRLKEKAKTDNAALKNIYQKIENEYQFPYLKTVVRNMSNNLSSYTAESLEDNCAVAEKEQSTKSEENTTQESSTQAEVKEESHEVEEDAIIEDAKEQSKNDVKEDSKNKVNSKKEKDNKKNVEKKKKVNKTNTAEEQEKGVIIE